MERILDLAKKRAQKAEVFRIEKNAAPACFFGGKLTALEGEDSVSTALRVIVDGRMGFSSTTHPTEVEGLVDRAIASAKFGPQVDLNFPSDVKHFGRSDYFDPKVAALSYDDLIKTGSEMSEIVLAQFPDVNLELEVTRETSRVSIMNTSGGNVSYEKSIFQSFLNVLMVMDSDRAELEHTATSTHLDQGARQMAKDAVWRFKNCLKVAPVQTKKMTVMFTSLAFRGLFVPLFYGLNGEAAFKKMSLMTGRLNEQVVDPRVVLTDDATQIGMPGSCPVDDEGVLCKPNTLIDKGVLKSYFYDLRGAGKAGVASTGNGFKKSSLYTGFSIDTPPNPTPSNFVLAPGNISRDDLIRSIREGIIVDDTIGAGQGNNLNGEFSVNVALGYKIENGEIVGRVKDVMVAGNVFDILKNNLRAMSSETWVEDTLFGRYRAPWVAFDDMPVSAT
jgi:PmbA protein